MPIVAPRTPGRLLRRGAGGGPDRADVPHPGLPALRRLPGQRLRAVADPRGRRTARPAGAVRHRPQPHAGGRHRGLLALQARPADPGPPLGGPGHAGPGAPHRRHREAGRHGQHLLRPGQPRLHGPHPPGQDRRHRGARPRGRRPVRRRRHPGARLGFDVRPDHRGGTPAARRGRARSRRPTCATSTRSRGTSARSCGVTTRWSCRR